jgi:hypothetical protein
LEVLLGLPSHGGEETGAAWVLDFSGQTALPAVLEDLIVFSVDGTNPGGGFGTDLQLLDCDEAVGKELAVSEPGASRGGQVVVFGRGSKEALGLWTLKGTAAFGVALLAFEQKGVPVLAVGACATAFGAPEACENDGALLVLPADSCGGSVASENVLFSDLVGMPQSFHLPLEGSSPFGESLVWAAPGQKTLLDVEGGTSPLSLSSSNDQGAFAQSLSGDEAQSWMASSGAVWQIEGLLQAGDVEAGNSISHSLEGLGLGERLVAVDDLDEDGCGDVLSTASDGQALYFLRGCPEEKTDTGDTGGTDTGEKPDIGDTGEEPCEESFGWACSTRGQSRSWGPSIFLMVLVFCASRVRETE